MRPPACEIWENAGNMSALQSFPRITPFLWFDSNAKEAVDFYLTVSVIPAAWTNCAIRAMRQGRRVESLRLPSNSMDSCLRR